MPVKNTIKIFTDNAHYHVYNRGIEGREIFKDTKDYMVFLSFMKRYLLDYKRIAATSNEVGPRWKTDIAEKIVLEAFCLMPNHFHFLIFQMKKGGITSFIRALMNSYVRYFNQKYKRNGGLFQSKYKAIMIDTEAYLLHVTRYIHLNPISIDGMDKAHLEMCYSSYGEYIGTRHTIWIHTENVLSNFGSSLNISYTKYASYRSFVESTEDSQEILGELALD